MDKIAVVILNWNGCEMLRRFLPSVLLNTGTEGVGVYVVDNGSTDQSVPVLRTEFPAVHLIILDKNYGFAEGYNLAFKQIDAEYLVLLNSDVEVTENWLNSLVEYMDTHPEVAACQPKMLSWHEKTKFEYAGASGGFIDKYGYPYCRGRLMNVVEEDREQYNTVISVFWATGAALFIRSDSFHRVGGLDGRFFAHMEEIDLCWRLRARGYSIVCVPQSVVYHVGAATLRKESPRKTFLNFRNNLIMLYKNLPEERFSHVMQVRRFLDYLAAIFFFVKGQLPNAVAVFRARRDFKRICGEFEEDRAVNMEKAVVKSIPEQSDAFILWQFYVKRKKYFSQL